MDCRRAEELFSDHLEATLPAPLRFELERHFATCEACRLLREALGEVVAALRALPQVEVPGDLAPRAATAALDAARRPAWAVVPPRMPLWMQALAAVLAIAITGALAAAGDKLSVPTRLGPRLAERGAQVSSFLVERKERLVEDVRLLRAVVGTAFEQRLDRVGARVEDYRRLLERRRALEQQAQPKPPGSGSSRDFPNPAPSGHVHQCEAGLNEASRDAGGRRL